MPGAGELTSVSAVLFPLMSAGRWRGAPVCVKVVEQQIMPGKSYDLSREPLLRLALHPAWKQLLLPIVVVSGASFMFWSWGGGLSVS